MTKRLVGLLAVLLLVAAACGDSGGDTTTETTTGETPTETTQAAPSQGAEGGVLQTVKDRGTLNCGVSGAATAFSETQPDGSTTGIDADFCRYVAAAVLGDANAVNFVALTAAERFTAVQTGAVDVLIRNTTWTQSRDSDVGMDFAPTTYYDGQQVMARERDGFDAGSGLADLEGAVICTNAGTTTEKNITEAMEAIGLAVGTDWNLVTYEDYDIVMENFLAEACDAVTTDGSGLVGRKATQQPDGENWIIFPSSPISKEPLGPVTGQNDSQWLDVVKWSVFTSIIFDEKGVTSANAGSSMGQIDGEVDRLLGGEGELQSAMGLDPDAWLNAVSQVGNYDEIFSRNLNPVGLFREGSLNASFLEGGLIYAPPAR